MNRQKITTCILALTLTTSTSLAQQNNGLEIATNTSVQGPYFQMGDTLDKTGGKKKVLRSLIVPGTLIIYGFCALEIHKLTVLDDAVQKDIREDNPNFRTHIDDYLQYSPAFLVYGLNAAGIKGKNNFRDRSMVYLLSNLIMAIPVKQ